MNPNPIDTTLTSQFFTGYLVDHFLYKFHLLYNVIEDFSELKPDVLKSIDQIDDEQFIKSMRLEIRATYFQAIETLFELIFSLEPKASIIDNRRIWYFLSTSEWHENYERIRSIAKGDTLFLDEEIEVGKDLYVPFSQYLFYFDVNDKSVIDSFKASLEPIKHFLVAFASEFSDRGDYNAFKHALRILPTFQKVEVGPQATQVPIITLDMSQSMSYLVAQDESITLHTKHLDTVRDMRMGIACSSLISNIVRGRRAHFDKNYKPFFYTFSEDSYPSAIKSNVKWNNFKLTLTPIYEKPNSPSETKNK